MTPADYCAAKVISKENGLYYCFKKIPAEKRQGVMAILAFYQEIESIMLKTTDLTVVMTQLNWWRDELSQMKQGRISHPVLRALSNAIPNIEIEKYTSIVLNLSFSLNLAPFETYEEVIIHLLRTAGLREKLIAEYLQIEALLQDESLYQAMLIIEYVHYIQHLRPYLRAGIFYFSEEERRQCDFSPFSLNLNHTSEELKKLLVLQASKLKRAYQGVKPFLGKAKADFLLGRVKVAIALLNAMEKSDFEVLENFITLTPLKAWWVSYY